MTEQTQLKGIVLPLITPLKDREKVRDILEKLEMRASGEGT